MSSNIRILWVKEMRSKWWEMSLLEIWYWLWRPKKNQSAQSTFIETAATSTFKLIKRFSLLQAYSNPFRSTTVPIRLTVSSQTWRSFIYCLCYKYNNKEAPEAGRKNNNNTNIQTYRHNTSIIENQRKRTTLVGQAGESLRGQNGKEGVASGCTSLTTDMRQTQNSENQNRKEEMKE